MTETKHTPGPWEVRPLLPDGIVVKRDGYEIHTSDYDVAAMIPYGGPIRKLADAYLIAAAPELLEALKALLPWVSKAQADGAFVNCVAPDGGIAAIDQAEDAIAKAEPETK